MVDIIEIGPLLVYFSVALSISFLCSLLEAILLTTNHSYVETLIKEGKKSGQRLKQQKENTDRSLAAILSLNTIAHTLGAAGVGAEVQKVYGNNWVTLGSIILTFAILVFSEVIPKSIGAAKWKRLAPGASKIINVLILVTFPLVWFLEKISRLIQPGGYHSKITKEEMIAQAEIGKTQGTLDDEETMVIKNLLRLDKITAEDVMTPSTVMLTFNTEEKVKDIVEEHSPIRFSRIPVLKKGLNDVQGFVLRNEMLRNYNTDNETETLGEFIHPIHVVSPKDKVGNLLDEFIRRQEHIFLVVDEHGGTEGIITLEDAIETLLGVEIVDEDDSVEDMRKLARELWERRRNANQFR